MSMLQPEVGARDAKFATHRRPVAASRLWPGRTETGRALQENCQSTKE